MGEGGVRVDDFAIVGLFLLVASEIKIKDITHPLIRAYLIFVLYSGCVAVYNGIAGRVDLAISLLFALRLLEYLVFFFVGLVIFRRGLDKYVWLILRVYVFYLIIIIPLQIIGIIPVISGFSNTRAIGNTNGPYELAAIAAGLSLLFLYSRRIALFWISIVICLAAAARITSVCLVLIILWNFRFFLLQQGRFWGDLNKATLVLIALIIATPIALTRLSLDFGVSGSGGDVVSLIDRLAEVSPTEFVEQLAENYDSAITYQTAKDYQNSAFEDAIAAARDQGGGDVSGLIRTYRWGTLLRATFSTPLGAAFGLGPSFGTSAVDGYYVRLICETGLIGLSIFLLWLFKSFRSKILPPWLKGYLVVMAATAIFIDIFVSFKPMILIWLFFGLAAASMQRRTEQ